MYRHAKLNKELFKDVSMNINNFIDVNKIADYNYKAVLWCIANDIATEKNNDVFDTDGITTETKFA